MRREAEDGLVGGDGVSAGRWGWDVPFSGTCANAEGRSLGCCSGQGIEGLL